MRKKYLSICLLIFVWFPLQAKAVNADSVRVSLLTCSPGQEIYSLFGHTALRFENPSRGIDFVFNYGMFSFNTPNFIWRFVKGETDYQLGGNEFPYFEMEYAMRGSSVYQQTLNLNPEEKQKLWEHLTENLLPQNRVYRYNFLFDNCTTRARDRVEDCISGRIVYDENKADLSYRDIIHQYTNGHPWSEFGIDLCLGSKADDLADYRQKMFAPFYLLHSVDSAKILSVSGTVRPLVLNSKEIVSATETDDNKKAVSCITPMVAGLFVLMITSFICICGIIKNRLYWGLDILLFGTAGLAGCIIAFLVFFSVHPAVSPNYLLLFLNPVHLFYLPFMIYRSVKRKKDWYHWINLIVLTLFILFFWAIPQKINLAVLPLALSLLICSASHLYLTYKWK